MYPAPVTQGESRMAGNVVQDVRRCQEDFDRYCDRKFLRRAGTGCQWSRQKPCPSRVLRSMARVVRGSVKICQRRLEAWRAGAPSRAVQSCIYDCCGLKLDEGCPGDCDRRHADKLDPPPCTRPQWCTRLGLGFRLAVSSASVPAGIILISMRESSERGFREDWPHRGA